MPVQPIEHSFPEETTEAQTFTAYVDDAVIDMTGFTVEAVVVDRTKTPVTLTGTVEWADASQAQWRYIPDGQLTAASSPYWVRAKITDGTGVILMHPNGREPDRWNVVNP